MVDFLRSNPWCSRDEYLWAMSVGQIRLASIDYTHVEYVDEKDMKAAGRAAGNRGAREMVMTDLGVPMEVE